MPPSASNPKGYFESVEIVRLHDQMLAALGSSWRDFRHLDSSLYASAIVASYKEKLIAALQREFGNPAQFILKDPRICRFFPLWRSIIESVGAELRVIIVSRNPVEVADSLAARDQLSANHSASLWLRHVLDAEFETRDCKRVFVQFADFVRDSWKVIAKIENELDIDLASDAADRRQAVQDFIDANLRHHVIADEALTAEYRDNPLVVSAYRALEQLDRQSDNREAMQVLDDVRHSFDASTTAIDVVQLTIDVRQLVDELTAAYSRISNMESVVAERGKEIDVLLNEIATFQSRVRQLESALAAKDSEIAALRAQQEADQQRISRFKAMIDAYLANEFRQRNEQCQLEQRIADLTGELEAFKNSLGGRIGRQVESLSRGFRGISGRAKAGSKLQ